MADGYLIFSGALTVLYFMAATTFIGHAIVSYRKALDQKSRQTDARTMMLCILSLLSMSVCMSLCILVSFGSLIFTEMDQLFKVFFTARVVFHLGITFVHLLFLNVLHVTFRNSEEYDYPLWIKRSLFGFIIILLIFIFFNCHVRLDGSKPHVMEYQVTL